MTLYHTPEEVNNLYSDNPPADPPPYSGPTPGQYTSSANPYTDQLSEILWKG